MSETALYGRLGPRREGDTYALEGWLVVAQAGDRTLGETITDGNGAFLLRLDLGGTDSVDLEVRQPEGESHSRRRLSSDDLYRGLYLEVPIDPLGVAPEPGPPPVRDWQVVDRGDLDGLVQLLETISDQELLEPHEAGWVMATLEELDALERRCMDLVGGESDALGDIARALRASPPWSLPDDWQPVPEPGGDLGCLLQPRHPYAVMWGGVALALVRDDPDWVDRAAGWYLDRAYRLNSVYRAAVDVMDGMARPERLGATVHAMAPLRVPANVSQPRSLPTVDDLDLCELEWMNCAYYFWHSGPITNHTPPQKIGEVQPNAVCEGYKGKLRLLPIPGEVFTGVGTGWVLALGAMPVNIVKETKKYIDIQMPPGVAPGCTSVGWTLDVADTSAFLNEMRQACQPFFGGGDNTPLPPFVYRGDVPLSVVGPARVVRFHAGGHKRQLVAEACTPVDLEWSITVEHCPGTAARAEVTLLADGAPLLTGLGLTGVYRVTDEVDVTYMLRVETFAGKTLCHEEERSITVQRYKVLRAGIGTQASLSGSRAVFAVDRDSPFSIDVGVSCQASTGGIPVVVWSSRPSRVAGGTVTIPQGVSTASFPATGQDCGEVSIQASAPGHLGATFSVLVVDPPQVTGIVPAQVTACTPFTLTVTANCAGGLVGADVGSPQISVTGQGQQVSATVIAVAVDPQDPFHGPNRIEATVPGLDAGNYIVTVTFRGRSGSASVPLQVTAAQPAIRSFTVSPSAVVSCVPAQVQLSWDVADTTQLKLYRGTTQIANLSRSPSCASWTGSQSGGWVDRETEFRIEAAPPAGSPVMARTRKVTEQHGIYSIAGSITLTNRSGMDLYIWSINSVGTDADLEELLFDDQTTTVQIAECARINLVAETTGDYTQTLKSTYYWRWNLPILGRTGRVYPPQEIY